jgi:hypothetical protein
MMKLCLKSIAAVGLVITAFASTADAKGFGGGGAKSGHVSVPHSSASKFTSKSASTKVGKASDLYRDKTGPIKVPGNSTRPAPMPPQKQGHNHRGGGWVLGGLAIAASDYSGCGYEYYKWKSTGSSAWRERYHDCRD